MTEGRQSRPEDVRLDNMFITFDHLLDILEPILVRINAIEGLFIARNLATNEDLDRMQEGARAYDPLGPIREQIAEILNRAGGPEQPPT